MLSQQDNDILTRVGPGTPMGELLRRYWTPALLSSELPSPGCDPVRVRLLCENLVAFRDLNGRVGLIQENCPHRGASLYFGRNEGATSDPRTPGDETCGLRCPYHGWQFDVDGNCIDMPSEPPTSSFKERVKAKSYPVHESGGVVWTYMGRADTMTPFRDFGTESLPAEYHRAAKLRSSCNWVQTMEGNVDTAHISWLHMFNAAADIPDDGTDKPGYPSNASTWKFWIHDRAPRLEVLDTWYGFRYAGLRTTPNGHTNVRITEYIVPYSTIIAAVPFNRRHLMVVPIDDHNCWRYTFNVSIPSNPQGYGGAPLHDLSPFETPFARRSGGGISPRDYVAENDYKIDRENQRDETFSGIRDFVSQDLMVTESMGPIYDRSQERLGTIDKAIIRMRSQLIRSAKQLVADGTLPPALAEPGNDFTKLRGADKILEDGEDWHYLGTEDDPVVREAEAAIHVVGGQSEGD
ncbi:Rieske 2Fe-2S domain-containing protein [Pseudonocardia sp. CA-142604]|uniref:Rieske 2Fe-2S domain-containing protein n=1 Tax=Pseudonocardia sp. CA-142604 TaxID=3240024 RepID=UPI003D8B58D4